MRPSVDEQLLMPALDYVLDFIRFHDSVLSSVHWSLEAFGI